MFLFSGEKCSLKLTIDTKTNRVVFAEATPNRFLDRDGGYAKGLIVYMVIDDFSVSPLSMISGLSKLTNVESTAEFEVKTIEFGVNEALEFLEASFQSKTVLSETFLKGVSLTISRLFGRKFMEIISFSFYNTIK
ncbi:hypothetical protein MTR67_024014 [Solanum verrucosum]|uniref:Uncharacterized protein n=1 Tax=Solanum verrucosum TaxID=315347 RepID=A0AAF0QUK6_SOLVR|nr:hypothetical protein MTR67_024014 [Solanum verrucosum]